MCSGGAGGRLNRGVSDKMRCGENRVLLLCSLTAFIFKMLMPAIEEAAAPPDKYSPYRTIKCNYRAFTCEEETALPRMHY